TSLKRQLNTIFVEPFLQEWTEKSSLRRRTGLPTKNGMCPTVSNLNSASPLLPSNSRPPASCCCKSEGCCTCKIEFRSTYLICQQPGKESLSINCSHIRRECQIQTTAASNRKTRTESVLRRENWSL